VCAGTTSGKGGDTKEVAEKFGQTKDTAREALRGSSGEPVVLLGPLQFAHPSLLVLFGMALLIGFFFPHRLMIEVFAFLSSFVCSN
jgi:hypothetical protein